MNERIPPYSEEAEKAVAGSLLLDGERVMTLAVTLFGLAPDAFYMLETQLVAAACWAVGLKDGGRGIDILTITQWMRENGTLDKAGGAQALERMVDATPTAAHAEYYLRILRDKWLLRKLITGTDELTQAAYKPMENVEQFCTAAPEKLMGLVNVATATEPDNGQVMDALIIRWSDAKDFRKGDASKKPAIGHETPWEDLTELMSGLEPGLTIIGGRPSAGKTTLEDILSHHVAKQGIPVGRVTMDSSRNSLQARALCREAEVSLPKLKGGYSNHRDLEHLEEAARMLRLLPIKVRDDLWDIASIRMWALNEVRKNGMGMLTVDYIQQVTAAEMGWQAGNALARTTYVIGKFKQLGQELKIPVVVLSQLSRPSKEKKASDPEMSDLRDSGALEQDAEKIILLSINKEKKDEMEGKVAGATKKKRPVTVGLVKHKDGETSGLEFWLYPNYFKFERATEDWLDDTLPGDEVYHGGGVKYSHNLSTPAIEED